MVESLTSVTHSEGNIGDAPCPGGARGERGCTDCRLPRQEMFTPPSAVCLVLVERDQRGMMGFLMTVKKRLL